MRFERDGSELSSEPQFTHGSVVVTPSWTSLGNEFMGSSVFAVPFKSIYKSRSNRSILGVQQQAQHGMEFPSPTSPNLQQYQCLWLGRHPKDHPLFSHPVWWNMS